MTMKSVINHSFAEIQRQQIPRSVFNLSCGYKTTFEASELIPFFYDCALPADTWKVQMNAIVRMLSPLEFPIMDNIFMDVHFFAVPNRLVWTNWVKMMGEQLAPGDSTNYTEPQITAPAVTGWTIGSYGDYLGIRTGIPGLETSALPFRAINLIYNEWYRDENFCQPATINTGNTGDDPSDYPVLLRGKRKDYFTSCLEEPQKGPEVTISLGDTAPVKGLGVTNNAAWTTGVPVYQTGESGTVTWDSYQDETNLAIQEDPDNAGFPLVYADLASASAPSINDIRRAVATQQLLELDNRGGTRYTESLLSHFGVQSSDARLQRPEFLGGGTIRISTNPVVQTSAASGQPTPQGNLSAYAVSGIGPGDGIGFIKSFEEHSIIIGFLSVRADLTYQQGIDRNHLRKTRLDYYWPVLAGIGEQAVLNKEIFAQGTSADDDVFGYQERYGELRYKRSQITGLLRSDAPSSLDAWHLSQDFAALPLLDDDFIQEAVPIDRIISVPSQPGFIMDSYMQITATRPLPAHGVPGLVRF